MSQRNTLEAKRARRARRTLTKGRLPASVDLVEWVRARSSLSTGRAMKVIMEGALRVDSHTVGVEQTKQGKMLKRYVPADVASRIQVVTPDSVKDS